MGDRGVSSFSYFLMLGFPQCLQNSNCPWNFAWAPLDPIQSQPLEVVLRNTLELQVQIPAVPGRSQAHRHPHPSLGREQTERWIFWISPNSSSGSWARRDFSGKEKGGWSGSRRQRPGFIQQREGRGEGRESSGSSLCTEKLPKQHRELPAGIITARTGFFQGTGGNLCSWTSSRIPESLHGSPQEASPRHLRIQSHSWADSHPSHALLQRRPLPKPWKNCPGMLRVPFGTAGSGCCSSARLPSESGCSRARLF